MNNKKTILIVDDVQFYIKIQKEYLKDSQVRILTAHDGIQALKTVKKYRPDLILMDMYMPNMDGLKCCQIIKTDTDLMHIPLIVVTGGGEDIERECSFVSLCDDYLAKPLNRKTYLSKASSYISGIELRQERIKCNIKANMRIHDSNVDCPLTNISLGGAYIVSDSHVLSDDVFHISFFLPDRTQVNCNCKIAWVNRLATKLPFGFGVEFVLLPKYAKEALNKFISLEKSANNSKPFKTEH